MQNSMKMRCLDTPDRNATRDKQRIENLSKPLEEKMVLKNPKLSKLVIFTVLINVHFLQVGA